MINKDQQVLVSQNIHDLKNIFNRSLILLKAVGAEENPYEGVIDDPESELEKTIDNINQLWTKLKDNLTERR